MSQQTDVVHLFIVNSIAGTTVVFLVETEPGVVEFPQVTVAPGEMDDEAALLERVRQTTGMDVAVGGFLSPPPGTTESAPGRILLARFVAGTPQITEPHVGWEWTAGSELLRMPFAPKFMVEELKSFMNI